MNTGRAILAVCSVLCIASNLFADEWTFHGRYPHVRQMVSSGPYVWVLTDYELTRHDERTNENVDFTPGNLPYSVWVDSANHPWILGPLPVQRHTDSGWVTYATSNTDLRGEFVIGIVQAGPKRFFVGTDTCLAVLDGSHWEIVRTGYSKPLFMDKQNRLWMSTLGRDTSFACYDGVNTTSLPSLPNPTGASPYTSIDAEGTVWAYCEGSLFAFRNNRWLIVPAGGMYPTAITQMATDSTAVWLAAERNLWKYDGTWRWYSVTSPFCIASSGALYAMLNGHVVKNDGVVDSVFSPVALNDYPLSDLPLTSIFTDSRGAVWATAQSNTVIANSGGSWRRIAWDKAPPVPGEPYYYPPPRPALRFMNVIDSESRLWFLDELGRIIRIHQTTYAIDTLLSAPDVYAPLQARRDSAGGVWVFDRVDSLRLWYYQGGVMRQVDASTIRGGDIKDIVIDGSNSCWIRTTGAILRRTGSGWERTTPALPLSSGMYDNGYNNLIKDSRNRLWCSLWRGEVGRWTGTGWKTYNYAADSAGAVYSLTRTWPWAGPLILDNRQNPWVGPAGPAIAWYDSLGDSLRAIGLSGTPGLASRLFVDSKGNRWVANEELSDRTFAWTTTGIHFLGSPSPTFNIFEDTHQKVWPGDVLRSSGIGFVDLNRPTAQGWYETTDYGSGTPAIPGGIRQALCDSAGTVWLLTTAGLLSYGTGNAGAVNPSGSRKPVASQLSASLEIRGGVVRIVCSIPEKTRITAYICDITGRVVAPLTDGEFGAGSHSLYWNYRHAGFTRGVYAAVIASSSARIAKRIAIVR